MLDELRIHGLGVIDEAVLPLGPGLTVVTGETGAGKTMVVTGLLLLFGGRADPARVRTGREQATVEGRVLIPAGSAAAERVRAAGGELDDDQLVLRRVVGANGRSRAYAGGAGVPAGVLAELAEHLVAVHGQSDQLRLVRPGAQRAALDRFAGIDLTPYAASYATWRALDAELADRVARSGELRREADLLTHGLAEIEQADPQPGEADALTALAARLGHADALTLAARTAHDTLLGNLEDQSGQSSDVVTLLGAGSRGLTQQAGEDPDLDELGRRVTELTALAADLGAELGRYAEQLDADPARLEQIEARRAVLAALVRRYCDEPEPSLDGVLRWADAARVRAQSLDVSDEALAALRHRRDEAATTTAGFALEVSQRRHEAGERLGAAATSELAGLAMADAHLGVDVRRRAPSAGGPVLTLDGHPTGLGPDGADEVELTLAAHPGAPPLPVGRGASGGELSRVMLALEVCLVDTDPVPTLVFDEVDAGVGGRAAVEVGRRLARLARDRQVLVVTHLPQVAAFADRQIVVDKPPAGAGSDAGGVTASDVRLVTADERVAELARMLSGSDSETAREHAAELLADAHRMRAENETSGRARGAVGPSGDARPPMPRAAGSRKRTKVPPRA